MKSHKCNFPTVSKSPATPADANKILLFSLRQKTLAPPPRTGGLSEARRRNWQVKLLLISNNFMV